MPVSENVKYIWRKVDSNRTLIRMVSDLLVVAGELRPAVNPFNRLRVCVCLRCMRPNNDYIFCCTISIFLDCALIVVTKTETIRATLNTLSQRFIASLPCRISLNNELMLLKRGFFSFLFRSRATLYNGVGCACGDETSSQSWLWKRPIRQNWEEIKTKIQGKRFQSFNHPKQRMKWKKHTHTTLKLAKQEHEEGKNKKKKRDSWNGISSSSSSCT